MIEDKKSQQYPIEITKTWKSGQNSCTMIISKRIAKDYGLTEPTHVVLEGRREGILIRKLRIGD